MEGSQLQILDDSSCTSSDAKRTWLELPPDVSHKDRGRRLWDSFVGKGKMGRGNNWSAAQDLALCTSWIAITGHPITGTNQTMNSFWYRVKEVYETESKDTKRTERAMRTRWNLIASSCQKFSGCYNTAEKTISSGMNEDNVLQCALETFAIDAENDFNQAKNEAAASGKDKTLAKVSFSFEFMECWNKLRTCPKFMESISKGSSPPERIFVSSVSDSTSPMPASHGFLNYAEFSNDVRPPGRKRAKRELGQAKFQEKVLSFMDDTITDRGEIRNYMKIMTASLLVHTRDVVLSRSEQKFFDDANVMFFESTIQPPCPEPAKDVSNNLPHVLPAHFSMPSSNSLDQYIDLGGELDSEQDSFYWIGNQGSGYTADDPYHNVPPHNGDQLDCNLGL